MRILLTAAAALAMTALPALGHADPSVSVVAAENFYGDVAQQVGGPGLKVTSILTNPDEDPHLFEASASTARALADARLVVYNGVDYDPWMTNLLAASKAEARTVIVAADLVHHKSGDNPHLWYDPGTMPAVAKALAAAFEAADPAHKPDYERRLQAFLASMDQINQKVAAMKAKYAGQWVTATEPVFGYMAEAIGLKVADQEFQLAVMNNTDPTAIQVAQFQFHLQHKQVKALLYNSQATDDLAQQMQSMAKSSGVPVVGVSETEPPGKTYQAWMMGQLDALDEALGGGAR